MTPRVRAARVAATVLMLALGAGGAGAGEAVFPPGSRIGLEPREGMAASRKFLGFERQAGGMTVNFVELPQPAFRDLNASFTPDNLKNQSFIQKSREEVKLPGDVPGVLLSGEQPITDGQNTATLRKWLLLVGDRTMTGLVVAQAAPNVETDEAVRAMLTSVRVRPALSLEDQIGALPFKIGNRGGFRPVRVLGGNSVLLTDGPQDQIVSLIQPILVLAEAVQPPPSADQRDAFARAALYSNQTLKDFAIERAQGFRQNGGEWHEIVARATDIASGMPVVVSQTIRFNPDGYFRAVGITRAEQREQNLPRFRTIVDSVSPR